MTECENSNGNININKYDNNINISPDNYNVIKCSCCIKKNKLTNNNYVYKWYLFQKIKNTSNHKRHNTMSAKKVKKNNIKTDDDNEIFFDDDYNMSFSYSDFIWVPETNVTNLKKYKNIPLSNSFEKQKIINKLEYTIGALEKKLMKKENDYKILNINFSKLLYRNKNNNSEKLLDTIDKLKTENKLLNNKLLKYTSDYNFLGLSFIEGDEDINFMDDKCFEEILDELEGGSNGAKKFNNNNKIKDNNEKIFYSSASKFYPNPYKQLSNLNNNIDSSFFHNLKNSINILLTQIEPSQSARKTLASILKQLGSTEDEINRKIGNSRGVISIPITNNRYKK